MRPHIQMYEKILSSSPLLFETAQRMRDQKISRPEEQTIDRELTDLVLAPTVVSFCGWVLTEAVRREIHCLYFLARDGWQFYQAAKRLRDAWKIPVQLRYLACSRYSLRIPCFFLMEEEEALSYICLRGMEVSFADMMCRAGLTEKDAEEIAEKIGYSENIFTPIPLTRISGFRYVLRDCPDFLEKMKRISKNAYEDTMRYFLQEGLFLNDSCAIVDSGWTGTTQQVLERMLRSGGKNVCLEGFYFGLYDLPPGADASCYHTFYFSWRGNFRRKAEFSNSLFEAIFSAPCGMTVGYARKEETGEVLPVYGREAGLQDREMRAQTQRIINFTEQFLQTVKTSRGFVFDPPKAAANMLEKMYRLLMARPDYEEAQRYGDYLFSDDVTERRTHPLAQPMTEEELLSGHILEKWLRLYVKKALPVKESAWYEGSAARCSGRAAWHQRHYRRYKRLIYARKGWERKMKQ